MRISDLEKMQQNLDFMKKNINHIEHMELNPKAQKAKVKQERRAVKKKINRIKHPNVTKIAKEEQIIVMITIAIVAITFIFSTSIFAKTISDNNTEKQEEVETKSMTNSEKIILEKNENVIQLEEILMENVSVLKSKEYAEEVRPVEFEVKYNENPNLPEGEEIVVREGIAGKQKVTAIKYYENNEFVSENILEQTTLEKATEQIVDIGTSKFLAKNKAHLGDKMYLLNEVTLVTEPDQNADEICTISKSIDVTLNKLENEDWCKVDYDGIEGYIKSKYLTTSAVTPKIIEANRIQRLKMTLSEDMPLNQSSGLSLEDYKKILSGNSSDKNHVIEENAEAFYNADKNYHMNGVFLVAIAIHESNWGTSIIANDKKNLFGYGSYDESPYESSFSFDTYSEGIDLLAKVLVKYYLNEQGIEIYEEELASGAYYNEPTIAGVNVRYASDEQWHEKIYKHMEYLYNRL